MLVDMNEVEWLSKNEIRNAADLLLKGWSQATGAPLRPPIPVEEIAEKHLQIRVDFDDLEEMLGMPDVLGATWVEEKRMVINERLLEGSEGRVTFTCAHEIGHWNLHLRYLEESVFRKGKVPSVVCRQASQKTRGEWQADHFAACLLLPEAEVASGYHSAFGAHPLGIYNERSCFKRKNGLVVDPSLATLKEIAEKVMDSGGFLNVSREAMVYRLQELGLIVNHTGKDLSSYFEASIPNRTNAPF
jgi:Zn-dependent peptidase ImmA (M78 family)